MYMSLRHIYACPLLSLEAGSVMNLELRWWPMRPRDPPLLSAGVKDVCTALPKFLGARDLNSCCRGYTASTHTLRAISQPLLFLSVFGLFHLTLVPLPKNDLNAVFYCRCITQTKSIMYVSNSCFVCSSVDLHLGLLGAVLQEGCTRVSLWHADFISFRCNIKKVHSWNMW